jgi:hypothetical protein
VTGDSTKSTDRDDDDSNQPHFRQPPNLARKNQAFKPQPAQLPRAAPAPPKQIQHRQATKRLERDLDAVSKQTTKFKRQVEQKFTNLILG